MDAWSPCSGWRSEWLRNLASGVYPPPPECPDPASLQVLHLNQSQMEGLLDEIRIQMQESRDMLAAG